MTHLNHLSFATRAFHPAVAAVVGLLLATGANAQTVVLNDTFEGASVRGSASGGFGAGTVSSVTNYVTAFDNSSFSIVSNTTTGPDEGVADNALRFNATANTRGFVAEFGPQSLINAGDMLTLRFDFRFLTQPTGGGTSGFRFGLYSSNGSSAVNNNSFADDNDPGYRADFAVSGVTAGSPTAQLRKESGTNGSVLSGSDSTQIGTDGTTGLAAVGTTSRQALFSLTRTAAGVDLALSIDGVSLVAASDTTGLLTSFNELAIGNGNITNPTFEVDNVLVQFVPEPGAAVSLLGGLGMLVGFRRIRVRA